MTIPMSASSQTQLQTYLRAVEQALRNGDAARAMNLSDEAVTKGFEHSHLLVLAAHHQLAIGAVERALNMAMRAKEASPRNVDALNVAGLALARAGKSKEAIRVFDAALRQSPSAAVVRFNRACALEDARELKRARTDFERVVELEPEHGEALAHLADLAVQRGDLTCARDCAARALRRSPAQAAALIALTQVDIAEGKNEQARARIEPLTLPSNTSAINRSIALGLLGDALEGLGLTADAFASYAQSQACLRTYYQPLFANEGETALARVRRLTTYFSARDKDAWSAGESGSQPVKEHVFLIGFPRSGTTLLEQVLASHRGLESMEERDCLIDAHNDFALPVDGPERLMQLGEEGLARYREHYWRRARESGALLERPVFLDKLPLNSVLLCAIARLFPQAKVLFALRDPRDVVFSCFRRRFVMTPQMFELTSLDGAANYYDAVMQLTEACRGCFGLEICDTRYEDLVNDFDGESRRLCAFIGLEWNESMRGFAERARAGLVNTPSAPQVARGLFAQGIGQWRRYRRELSPVLPKLAPWVARFGYRE